MLAPILCRARAIGSAVNMRSIYVEGSSSRSKDFCGGFKRTGLFGTELLNDPVDFKRINALVRKSTGNLVDQILNNKGSRKTVALVDDLSNEICCAADLAECVRLMHTNSEFKQAAEESVREFTELIETLNTRSDIYKALKNSLETEKSNLTAIDKRTTQLFLVDFECSGVHLPEKEKEEFVRLSGLIFDAGSQFVHGASEPVSVTASECNKHGVSYSLVHPHSFATSGETRKWAYSQYYRFNEKQEIAVRRLISSRHRLANLTGFQTYAHREQNFTILGSYENAHSFLMEVVKSCRPLAEKELTLLYDVLSQYELQSEQVGEWDLQYLMAVYRRKAYGSMESMSRYLSLKNVLHGFEKVMKNLYDVHFQFEMPISGEIWHGNILKLVVLNGDNSKIGVIYLDVENRETKVVGDCHFTVRCSKVLVDGSFQKPIVVVSLSLASAQQSMETIFLNVHQADNFFHEMGHAMHSMLGQTIYQHVAGTRCPTDFAEIPSNLMEYFFNDFSVFRSIASDSCGNQVTVPEAARMISSRYAFTAIELLQQTIYALFDLEIHGHNAAGFVDSSFSSSDLFNSIWSTVFPTVQRIESCAWQHRFAHLNAYGAKYYSYIVARAAASLIWHTQFKESPLSSNMGRKWAKVQSYGGSLPSIDLLNMMLAHRPTSKNLADAIEREAESTCQISVSGF